MQEWQNEWGFSLCYKWKHGEDSYFQKQVSMGLKDPVDISKLEDPEYQPLKRGIFNLKLEDLEIIASQLDTILQHSVRIGNDRTGRMDTV